MTFPLYGCIHEFITHWFSKSRTPKKLSTFFHALNHNTRLNTENLLALNDKNDFQKIYYKERTAVFENILARVKNYRPRADGQPFLLFSEIMCNIKHVQDAPLTNWSQPDWHLCLSYKTLQHILKCDFHLTHILFSNHLFPSGIDSG